ncbi:MAG: hypothetical protein R3C28_06560 [Pirellulaceae bacterium]
MYRTDCLFRSTLSPPGGRNIFAGMRQPPVVARFYSVQPSGRHMRILEDAQNHNRSD